MMTLYVDCKCRMAQASDCGHCKGTGFAPTSTTELITAVRAGVESGTIKGATEKRHAPDGHVPSIRYSDACSKDCRFVDVLVIPVSDGGSET